MIRFPFSLFLLTAFLLCGAILLGSNSQQVFATQKTAKTFRTQADQPGVIPTNLYAQGYMDGYRQGIDQCSSDTTIYEDVPYPTPQPSTQYQQGYDNGFSNAQQNCQNKELPS